MIGWLSASPDVSHAALLIPWTTTPPNQIRDRDVSQRGRPHVRPLFTLTNSSFCFIYSVFLCCLIVIAFPFCLISQITISILRVKMKFSSTTALCLLTSLPASDAWGSLGHEAVAYVASNFVATDTKSYFQAILRNETDSYLAGVATWADSFRYTAAGRFTAPFHFIDAEDNPPSSCGVKFSRDCPKQGCVVAAIQNYVCGILSE